MKIAENAFGLNRGYDFIRKVLWWELEYKDIRFY